MEKISWTDRMRNEVLRRAMEERNNHKTIKRGTGNWIGYFVGRKCLLKYVIEGKIEGKGRSDGKTRKETSAAAGSP
jgi:hypothetical protein